MFSAAPRYLALCPRPTEPLCAAELRGLGGVSAVEVLQGAVAFSGPPEALYRANLWLRCATRVLCSVADFPCSGERDLYAGAREVPWEEHLPRGGTLAVAAHGQLPGLDNSMFTALRVKDAVVDRFRDRSPTGARPDVDPADPDLRINVQLYQRGAEPRAALALDSSSQPLHQRGYRKQASAAPLKETLAAAILALSGYGAGAEGQRPLCDPLCGGGTLVIEGGLMALDHAPGLLRRFGFERWRGFDAALWRQLRAEAEARRRRQGEAFLHGSDLDRRMVQAARDNAALAGIGASTRFEVRPLEEARAPAGPAGVVVCNPPYGERMGEEGELVALYRQLGDTLKRHFTGWTAYVFTASLPLSRQIGLRSKERHILYNGNLEGRLLRFDLF